MVGDTRGSMAKKKITKDDLAGMIQNGFIEVHERIDGLSVKVEQLRSDFEDHREESRKDHADIRFKLSETVSRVEHNQLTRRVEALESQRR